MTRRDVCACGAVIALVACCLAWTAAREPAPGRFDEPQPVVTDTTLDYRTAKTSRSVRRPVPPAVAAKLYARDRVKPSQWPCLRRLWHAESRWNHRAHNRSSGAYGIPQALPGHKMRTAGRDWRTNPKTQIRWGLGYVEDRYGSPCAAWTAHNTKGWY